MINKTTIYENLCSCYKSLRKSGELKEQILGQLLIAEDELPTENDEVVQYIVVRQDLNMSPGKMIAQCCHATKGFMLYSLNYSTEEKEWLDGSHATIVLGIKSEDKLINLAEKANELNIKCHVVTDEGRTEFNGVSTKTCLALGPARKSVLAPLTKRLRLFETKSQESV